MSDINKPFAIADVETGVLNALVKKIMRQTGEHDANEAVRLVTSGEWLVKKPKREWREKDGVIYLEVSSVTGIFPGWLRWCEKRTIGLHGSAAEILRSWQAEQLTPNTIYKVAIIRRTKHLTTIGHVRDEALRRGWINPPIEIACLIREKFSDWEIKAMGISFIFVMHKPVMGITPSILSVYSSDEYENFIWVQPNHGDSDPATADVGYAFLIPEAAATT